MKSDKWSLIAPLFLIAVGSGWLLTSFGIMPGVDWIWTMGLAMVGFGTFAVSGIDKVSIVLGSFFGLASVLSVLRQTGAIQIDVELPILVICAGVLLLLARTPAIPFPQWVIQELSAEPPRSAG
jgi:hypothetical protein